MFIISRVSQHIRSVSYFSRFSQITNSKFICKKTTPSHFFLRKIMASSSSLSQKKYTNHLINEKSPYLIQHAHNPVDWYPWSDEAINKAKTENKLIFLSIGYSTCHWCSVMEKESFENEETARIMNENFINIKVDREELPHIDKLYMQFVLLINGSGGWPLSVWLTPDLAPITGGTYFPATDRYGMPAFKTVLQKIAQKWQADERDLKTTGQAVIDAIKNSVSQRQTESDEENETSAMTIEDKMKLSMRIYKRNFDSHWGGSSGAPKFPEISKINLLFHIYQQTKDVEILEITLNTLNRIANGGIHDHLGGGFCRYSVDKRWHIPHFEKMLYDQSQFLMAYSNAYKITRNKKYLKIADKTFKYMCRNLYHPLGGFFSAEDADSKPTHDSTEKIEGAFYAWDYEEIVSIFEKNKEKFAEFEDLNPLEVYCYHFDIKKNGNVEPASDPQGHLLSKNILFIIGSYQNTADKFSSSVETIEKLVEIGNNLLYNVRADRPRPHLDRKIICSWNGLALSGISKLATIQDSEITEEYLTIAKKHVDFIRTNLYDPESRKLLRACYGSDEGLSKLEKPVHGLLDDYAFLIKGLLDFYLASFDVSVLYWAKELQDIQDELFWDKHNGGYFYSEANAPNVVVRMKEDHDGAEPCGNSVACHNLIMLGAYFEDKEYKEKAAKMGSFFQSINPMGYVLPEMLSAQLMADVGLTMLVVVGPNNDDSRKLLQVASDFYIPGLVSIFLKICSPHDLTRKSVQKFKMIQNKPTVYTCHNKRCNLPITDSDALHEELSGIYLAINRNSTN